MNQNNVARECVFLDACRGKQTPYTPIWLNRQAGRYMPKYRQVKGDRKSIEFFTNPELAAEITLIAQRLLNVDAAIVFADLLPILQPMGLQLDYIPQVGPTFANPIRNTKDVKKLRTITAEEDTGYIAQTIQNVKQDLPTEIGLIGFAGAPFTLAAYAIEGRSTQHFNLVRTFMYSHPDSWIQLLDTITESVISYVKLQIQTGIDVLQIFDSWIGCLAETEYLQYVSPFIQRLFQSIANTVPTIYFGTSNAHLLKAMYNTGPNVMALDWRVNLVETWNNLGCRAIQGNLDPMTLCADTDLMLQHTRNILNSVNHKPGHIFNLGHGITPTTDVDQVKKLVDFVHEYSQR